MTLPRKLPRRQVLAALGAAAAATVLTGCSGRAERSVAPSTVPPASESGQVGRYASPNPGSVNVFWLPTPQGFVIVDGGRNVAGGRRVVQDIQRTGRPVVAILITHSHPDHVGGLGPLREGFPQAPIFASEATADLMRTDPLMFYPAARKDDPDYPAQITFPDRTFEAGAVLDLGGIRLETLQLGPGESAAATAYYEPDSGALFSGDVTSNKATPALIEGATCAWLTNLDQLQSRFPTARTLYPGHGDPADPDTQIQEQATYLQTFRGLVWPAIDPGSTAGPSVSADEQASILAEMERRYPGYPLVAALPTLREANVAAVAQELSTANPDTVPPQCRP